MTNREQEAAVWDDARIREAFIYDGGESAYHDPINGEKEQRRIAGEIFDRWLEAHDAALLASRVSTPPTITDDMAAFDEAIRSVEAWHSDDETVAAQYAGVREGLIRGREIALRRFCVCTPAIAGISDGPSVDCPTHGTTTSGAF